MGCASSTPMIQTTGSEMLKAATHVASDATKTAEDVVQGAKDTVEKTLETAKDSVATTVEGVKHEVENVVKEKTEMLEDAKNSLMKKLHLSDGTEKHELNEELASKRETSTELATASVTDENVEEQIQHEIDSTMKTTSSVSEMKHILTRTDTETDSLNTSIPEPEIEQAFANSKHKNKNDGDEDNDDDDDDDNPPTPQPTLSELENLKTEVIHQQQHEQQQQQQSAITSTMVNDISTNNDLLMTTTHDNIKPTDITTAIESTTKIIKANETSSSPPHPPLSNTMHEKSTPPLFPLPIATTVIATATTQPRKEIQVKQKAQTEQKLKKTKPIKREEKVPKYNNEHSSTQNEDKRPRTTEWEKFADMLAQHRKYNPHDAFRRGGTLTKFGGNNRPSHVGHHLRGNGGTGDDDSSDTASTWRGSPHNSQRSSARAGGRIQRLPNRPNTGNHRKNHHEFSSINGVPKPPSIGRRNSNAITNGRKFDYNPTRPRLNDYISTVSSIPYSSQSSSLQPALSTQLPNAPYESVKSPSELRSQHSRPRSRTPHHLEPLERPRSRSQQQHQSAHSPEQNGSSMPFKSSTTIQQQHYTETLTRESSKTSLFSNSSNVEIGHSFKSSLDLRLLSTNPPVRNTSSFLTTPRCSPFSVRKSYTDLYFSSTSNKENTKNFGTDLSSVAKQRQLKEKSPYKVRHRCDVCCKKYVIK